MEKNRLIDQINFKRGQKKYLIYKFYSNNFPHFYFYFVTAFYSAIRAEVGTLLHISN